MKKIISTLSIFFIYLSVFAQGSGDSSIEYKATTIIPTEFNGIKIGSPNIGKQLLDKGFIYDGGYDGGCYYCLPDSSSFNFLGSWKGIYVIDNMMSFGGVIKETMSRKFARGVIWAIFRNKLSPEQKQYPEMIFEKEECEITWRDSIGNELVLRFDNELCIMVIFPANHSKPIAYSNNVGSYEYVDLGLSVKWATCNVGASRPEEYGDYYAWGETNKKTTYYWNYKYSKGNVRTLTKYCNNSNYGHSGFSDYKTILELSDDAAQVNCGGSWRMPTATEWNELINNCIWIWKCKNGIYGFEVRSKCNNNFIFLPAAGDKYRDDLFLDNESGFYWSSSLNTDDPDHAKGVRLCSDGVSHCNHRRYTGLSIRPVCQ